MQKKNYVGLEAFKTASPIDSIDALIAKIKRVGSNMVLHDWIMDYEVPLGTQESPLELVECVKRAFEWKSKQALKDHPASVISHVLETKDISFTVDEIVVQAVDESNPEQVFVADQSYYVPKDGHNDRAVVNAQTADYLAYGCRVLKDFSISNSFGMKSCSFLSLPYAEFTDVMGVLIDFLRDFSGGGVKSPGLVRDALFTNFEHKSGLSIYLWALFNERTKSGVFDETVAAICKKTFKAVENLPPCRGFCHVTQTLKFPPCDSVNLLYSLINGHTQLRGQVTGLSALNACYYWNSLSRSVSKVITKVVEIIEICRNIQCNIVNLEKDYCSEYEKNVLVANGITVVDGSINSPCVEDSKVGIYGSTKLPCIHFFVKRGMMPKVTKKGVEHLFDPVNIKNLFPTEGYYFFKIYFHDGLNSLIQDGTLFLHPTLDPSHPEVFLTNYKIYKDLTLEMMVQRCARAAHYRTLFPYNRLPFVVVDEFSPETGVSVPLKLCRRGGKLENIKSPITALESLKEMTKHVPMVKRTVYTEFVDLEEEDEVIKPAEFNGKEVLEKFRNEMSNIVQINNMEVLKKSDAFGVIRGIVKENPLIIPVAFKSLGTMTLNQLGDTFPEYADIFATMREEVLNPRPLPEKKPNKNPPAKRVEEKVAPVVIVPEQEIDLDDADFEAINLTSKKSLKDKKKN